MNTVAPDAPTHLHAPHRHVRVEADGALRVLWLDRPPLNVLDIEALVELKSAVESIGRDPEASVLMITGHGKAFSAGVDVADHTADRVATMIEVLHGALTAVTELSIPVVAAVNGAALGGGLELALACDVIIAREGAKLGQPEVQLGVFPPFAAAVLPGRIGEAAALDLCLTGRIITAEEGLRLGLVQYVFDTQAFASSPREYAQRLAGLSRAVLALTKRAVREGSQRPVSEALVAAERIYLDELMKLEDAHEGLAAFVEKRSPVWKGA